MLPSSCERAASRFSPSVFSGESPVSAPVRLRVSRYALFAFCLTFFIIIIFVTAAVVEESEVNVMDAVSNVAEDEYAKVQQLYQYEAGLRKLIRRVRSRIQSSLKSQLYSLDQKRFFRLAKRSAINDTLTDSVALLSSASTTASSDNGTFNSNATSELLNITFSTDGDVGTMKTTSSVVTVVPSSTVTSQPTNATTTNATSTTSRPSTTTTSTEATTSPERTLLALGDPLSRKSTGLQNITNCVQFTEEQLVKELKQQGTYNPDFMAWDVRGVLNFFERASTDNYDKLKKSQDRSMSMEQNVAAVEQLVKELNLQNCNLRTPDVLAKLYNLSSSTKSGGADTPSFLDDYGRLRTRRKADDAQEEATADSLMAKAKYIVELYKSKSDISKRDDSSRITASDSSDRGSPAGKSGSGEETNVVGQIHVVPSGCRKRGSSEDGFLRLCGACQAIRRLPDTFFPPFLNEVTCDDDKACLYFYDYPHGKCRQKHLNLVVLKNVGSADCQLWKRYNLNVRVSCECFVDEMSFFAKYV